MENNFFRIAGTLQAEISVSGKRQCLLAIGVDREVCFLEGRSPLISNHILFYHLPLWVNCINYRPVHP